MEINGITKKLLSEGWIKEQTPAGMRNWNDFYGGWTYDPKTLSGLVFETPCGLLVNGYHFVCGSMSFMGIEWAPENNNPTITCPKFDIAECDLQNEILRISGMRGSREKLRFCACAQSSRPFDYESSLDKAHKDIWDDADVRWKAFAESRNGRACRIQSNYDRNAKSWSMHYDPMDCARQVCQHCDILNCDVSPKKANIFYDLKCIVPVSGEGLFPDETKVTITKGIKLFDKPVSETICNTCMKSPRYVEESILHRKKGTRDNLLGIKYEVLNMRVERRESRDLLQDLRDVSEGISVVHASDAQKAAKAAKSQRRSDAKARKLARLENLIVERGYGGLDEIDRRRAEKAFDREHISQLLAERKKRSESSVCRAEQMSIFEEQRRETLETDTSND